MADPVKVPTKAELAELKADAKAKQELADKNRGPAWVAYQNAAINAEKRYNAAATAYSNANSTSESEETSGVSQTYQDYIAWQRQQAEATIAAYRKALKSQARAYETKSLAALPKMQKSLWEQMYKNLDQRGLSDSTSFRAGAKVNLEDWTTQQKSDIWETKQSIEATGQQAILAGLGKPDYASLYGNWLNIDQQQAAYNDREYQRAYDEWDKGGRKGPAPQIYEYK